MKIENDHIPLKRPHYKLIGNCLFFLISKRPYLELLPEELGLYGRVDGVATVAELLQDSPGARAILMRWWEAEVIELAQAPFSPVRKKVLVIEPHMDDAALSVGGLMWELRNTHEFTVVSVVGVSNFTSYHRIDRDYFDVGTVSELRKQESDLVMRILGGRHMALDHHDAPLRFQPGNWTLDWYRRNRRSIAAFINHCPVDEEVQSCAEKIREVIGVANAEEIWIPMGVGTSTDHETTRNACLLALIDSHGGPRQSVVILYQDVPYAMNFPRHSGQILSALSDAGATLSPRTADVTAAMPAKLRMVSMFASQFKMSYMGHRVEATARLAAPVGAEFGERLVRVDKLPPVLDLFELYSGRNHVRELSAILSGWSRRNRKAHRITMLCPMGVGRWRESMEVMLRSFPNSLIDLHLTADGFDETLRFSSPRIRIHPVEPRGRAWLGRIIKVLLSGSRPLIVLTGWKFRRLGPLIRVGCILFDALPAVSIGHLILALNDSGASREGNPEGASIR